MIQDLALILIVAALVTLLFKKLKQPLVLGYIVAGFLVSSNMPYIASVVNKANIEEWADIGVTFTLFSLGLEFSFKKIVKMGAAPIISTITIVTCMTLLGFSVGKAFGWGFIDCIFLGGMLAMSSTTIIYKAFDDLGLSQQSFAATVMSVLILEDILAIVMMVMLAAMAEGDNPDTLEMLMSILKIAFFLILWFVVGIFAVPAFLRHCRSLMNSETLLVVSLGLCCLMAVVSEAAGFSKAFGAFVMGSILAETIEAEKIEHIIEPVKNLFGAIFFVSVGMLVDPKVIVDYSGPIVILVLAIVIGQAVFGTFGYFLSGQTLRNSLRCGFSMGQIGEFAFIIASLGLSLHVIADYLYPVVVAVSVITTFITPYMIRSADPVYHVLEKHLPKSIILTINSLTTHHKSDDDNAIDDPVHTEAQLWRRILRSMTINTIVYGILSLTVILLMIQLAAPIIATILPAPWEDITTAILTIILISPFLRAIIMKKNKSEEWHALWNLSHVNRFPLISTVVARAAICLGFILYVCTELTDYNNSILFCVGIIFIVAIVFSRFIKNRSVKMEKMFMKNLRSRDIAAQVSGQKSPAFAERLLDRDIHIADVKIPANSIWAGDSLAGVNFTERFGIAVSSILRDGRRINIPSAVELILPHDRLQIIGSDEQIARFASAIKSEIFATNPDIESMEMILRQMIITKTSPFLGKSLRASGMRNDYHLMLVGLETGENDLLRVGPDYIFQLDDVLWVVGERTSSLLK